MKEELKQKISRDVAELKDLLERTKSKPRAKEGSVPEKAFNELVEQGLEIEEVLKSCNITDEKLYSYTRYWIKKVNPTPVQIPTEQRLLEVETPATKDGDVDMKWYVPKKDGYISRRMHGTTDVELMKSLYRNKDFVLIIGETGSGKTHLVRNVAFIYKVPYMRVNMNGATTPEDLAGQWIPNPNPDSSAKYIWQDGVLTRFMKNGGIFVVDEINMTPADILSMFHSVTDDEKRLVLTQKDGEVITAHPNFWFVCTMNPDYEGTKPLNLALKDRFRTIYLDYSDKVEKKLNIDEKMLEVAGTLRASNEISTPVSTRDLLKYRDDSVKYGDKVARAFFINNFESGDEQSVVKEIVELLIDGKKIPEPEQEQQQVGVQNVP